jgi:hypothetical protein
MKKFYAFALLGIPLCLILGFGTTQPIGENGGQEEQAQVAPYHRETEYVSMKEVGKLLEQLGKEIQQNSRVTMGGNSYPVTDQGVLEISVRPRRGGTSMQIEMSSGQKEPPTKGKTYVSYARLSQRSTPAEFAELLAEVGKNLASTGAFVMEDHSVALKGTASVVERLMGRTRQFPGGRQRPYTFYVDVVLGEKDFPLPEDEEDGVEDVKRGDIKELAKKEMNGADKKAIAKLFDSLSGDLKAGRVSVGDKNLDVGKNIMFGLTHLIAADGKSERIRAGFQFGTLPPQQQPSGSKYSKEFFDAPMKQVGALMKRMGTEILESGSFKLEENEFPVGKTAIYEVKANERGFSIELQYSKPPKTK